MRDDRRGDAAPDAAADHPAARQRSLISAGIFAFTLSSERIFIYALAFIQSAEKKTSSVAVLTQLVEW